MTGQTDNHAKRNRSQMDFVDNGESKRRKSSDRRGSPGLETKDTIYRYLCPIKKVGSIIGRGGEIVRQLRSNSEAKIVIGESIRGCEERIVTICSSSDTINAIEGTGDYVCPAQDALFKVHERLVTSESSADEDFDINTSEVSVRLLVPSDQIGHIIGKGGQTIHSIRNDSGAYVRIFKGEHLPLCANSSDELIEITGEPSSVEKALFQVSCHLHENPSRIYSGISHAELHDDTVFRYLCLERSIGSVIGKGGEIVKQLRADSQAKITIGERVPGCKERVVTICSSTEKTNAFGDTGDFICPAQDALFKLHELLLRNDPTSDEDFDVGVSKTSVRLLVPSDQIGHIIGKGGHIIQDIRSSTGASIHVLKDECLPPCAHSGDEILQITGEAPNVKKALLQVSSCLRDRPSRSYRLLPSDDNHAQLHRGNVGERVSSHHDRDGSSSKWFALCLLCPAANVARVIGKDGSAINQIREQSGASIKVDSSTAEDDCIILISGKDASSTIYAAVRLQPRCSEMTKWEHGEPLYTTRLLVRTSQIGCLIGKGGSVITEMRRATQANIRIMPKENLPKVASEHDELVQISGELDSVRNALIQISNHLKAHISGKESDAAENYEYDSSKFL